MSFLRIQLAIINWFYGPLLAILINLGGIKIFPIATCPLIINGKPKNHVRSESTYKIEVSLNQNKN